MKLLWTLVLGFLIVVPHFAAYGQQTTSEVTGTVTDASGAVIPGATVKATNIATQQVRATTSNQSGNYDIPYLAPGDYTIQATKSEFKTESEPNIAVTVGAVLRMDFKMEVGAVTQQVEVTTAEPLVSTESTAIENDVPHQQIVAMPLNGRDYLQLVALNPNVVSETGVTSGLIGLSGARAQDVISVAGQRLEYNHYTLDGIENTEPNYNTYIIHPSVDALQEFTVLTGIYSAEFGRGASQINATTLPGGNTYHGVAYDFIRNDAADARIWLQTGPKNPFHRNDYGFVLGGPLSIPRLFNAKNKLFFDSSFESLRDDETLQEFGSVPTQDMINGNFNDNLHGELPIYWPLSQVFSGPNEGACQISSGGSYGPTTNTCTVSGTLNVIPSADISPIATKLMSLLPPPNQFGGPNEEMAYANDYIAEQPSLTQETQFNQRIDWTQNARASWFGRFSWEDDLYHPASVFGAITADVTNSTVKQIVVGNTFIINPHMVNDARVGWDSFYNGNSSPFAGGSFDPQASLGITGVYATNAEDYGYPSVGFGSGISGYGGASPYITHDDIYSYMDSLSIIKGNHTIKLGGAFEADQFNELGNQFGTGTIGSNGDDTLNPALGTTTTASGFGLADVELGYVSSIYIRISQLANVEMRRKDYSAFLQDDWKVRPNLTLNLGIRYDNFRPWIDKHNNFLNMQVFTTGVTVQSAAQHTEPLVNINAGAPSPIYTRPGPAGCNFYASATLEFSEPGQPVQCGDQYMGRSTMNPNNENFGPRIGLDYALGAKTSIRTGYGLYYVTDQDEYAFDMGRNLGGKDGQQPVPLGEYVPLSAPWSLEAANAGCGPNQYNGQITWTGPCEAAPQVDITDQHNRTTYVEQYMFNVERQLSQNVALEVAYMGNESHHDLRYFVLNQVVPKTGPTDTRSETARRPWPTLGNLQLVKDWDRGAYNAMDVKVTQRISHGLLYMVAFTWGHSIDFGSAYRNTGDDTLWPDNSYWPQIDRGSSQFNQPRRFVASFVYNLPFGAGAAFAPSNPFVNHIVSGWTFGGILTLGDGTSINASSAGDPAQLDTLGTQPQWQGISQYRSSHPGVTATHPYWNQAAFACAYTAAPTSYCSTPGYLNQSWQEGNWARNNLPSPGLEDFDANLGRTFHFWESHELLVRFEAFNATNRVNWGLPASTNPASATFGVITNTTENMRELQAALKYSF